MEPFERCCKRPDAVVPVATFARENPALLSEVVHNAVCHEVVKLAPHVVIHIHPAAISFPLTLLFFLGRLAAVCLLFDDSVT